jgi:hypothetical protein
MELQLTANVLDPKGGDIKIFGLDGDPKKATTLTINVLLDTLLSIPLEEDKAKGIKHYVKLGDLMKQIHEAKGTVEIDSADIAMLKERVPYAFNGNPGIVWGCCLALEGGCNAPAGKRRK